MPNLYSEDSKAGELCKSIEACCLRINPYDIPDCELKADLRNILIKIDDETGVQGISGFIKGYTRRRLYNPADKTFNFKDATVYANFSSLCGELEKEEVLKMFQDYLGEPTKFETFFPAYTLTYKIKFCIKTMTDNYPVYKEKIVEEFIKTLEIEVRGDMTLDMEPDFID